MRTVPTVDVFIEVRSGHANWHWTAYPSGAIAEMVYNRPELLKVLRVYGVWASRLTNGAHIRVTARGRFSGRWLAEWQWVGGQPWGEPWVHVPAWTSLTLSAQLHIPRYVEHDEHRLIDTGGTDVSTLRLTPITDDMTAPPDQGPYVRHKEDVPHEGALPDLYGLQGLPEAL